MRFLSLCFYQGNSHSLSRNTGRGFLFRAIVEREQKMRRLKCRRAENALDVSGERKCFVMVGIISCVATVGCFIVAVYQVWQQERRHAKRLDAALNDDLLIQSDGDEDAIPTSCRINTRYAIDGEGCFCKSRMVLEVIKRYVAKHPQTTYEELLTVFPKSARGVVREKSFWGCLNLKEDAEDLYKDTGRARHFLKTDEVISLRDGRVIAVSSQWGAGNIPLFIDVAQKAGFRVTKV